MPTQRMTQKQLSSAYQAVAERHQLRWWQRDVLDVSPVFHVIMRAEHDGDREHVAELIAPIAALPKPGVDE